MTNNYQQTLTARQKLRLVFRPIFSTALMGVALFYLPGNYRYWQGWIYFATFVYLVIFTMLILPPGLSVERMAPGKNVKKWDYVFISLYTLLNFIIPLFCAYDANQLKWSNIVPPYASVIASFFVVAGASLTIWSTWTNQYFSSMVRIQKDRGQTVIQDGPYRLVRHPGYLGGVTLYAFLPFSLNSVLGIVGSIVLIAAFIVRTYLEDTTLQNELEGYTEYAKKVKKRLLPFIW